MGYLTRYRRPYNIARKVVKASAKWDYGTIHRIDGNLVSLTIRGSTNLIRHVSVIGDIRALKIGDTVPLTWTDGRPIATAPVNNLFEGVVASGSSDTGIIYPTNWTAFFDEADCPNTFTVTNTTSQSYNIHWMGASAADGDIFILRPYIKQGAYVLRLLGTSYSNRGKIDIYFDDDLIYSGLDWYSSSATYNVENLIGVVVKFSGHHSLQLVVNGKNASSSGYNLSLTTISLLSNTNGV